MTIPSSLSARACAHVALALALTLPALTAQGQATAAGKGRDLRVPPMIGEFQLMGSKRIAPAEGGGYVLRYQRADSLSADLFIYAGPDFGTQCAPECAQRLLTTEGDGFVSAIPMLIERKYMDAATVRVDSLLVPPSGSAWRLGRRISLDEVRDGAPVWSDFYLFYVEGVRVKLRATYRRDAALVDAIAALAAATVPALIIPDEAATRPPE